MPRFGQPQRRALLDATVVRGMLLPSVMALLGDRNWYLPRWLSWLPPTPRRRHRVRPVPAPGPPHPPPAARA